MMKPECFRVPHVTSRNVPYSSAGTPPTDKFLGGGVLAKGQTVWLECGPHEESAKPLVSAFVKHLGVIVVDARFLVDLGQHIISKETGITVTALQPGPTDTDFFHRTGMDDTEVGQKGKSESQPDDVARQGIEALLAGRDHVYAASFKTKLEGALANVVPGDVKAAMHEKMAKPNSEK
jgi:hypothetical protein